VAVGLKEKGPSWYQQLRCVFVASWKGYPSWWALLRFFCWYQVSPTVLFPFYGTDSLKKIVSRLFRSKVTGPRIVGVELADLLHFVEVSYGSIEDFLFQSGGIPIVGIN
jgi:hypothetical protein